MCILISVMVRVSYICASFVIIEQHSRLDEDSSIKPSSLDAPGLFDNQDLRSKRLRYEELLRYIKRYIVELKRTEFHVVVTLPLSSNGAKGNWSQPSPPPTIEITRTAINILLRKRTPHSRMPESPKAQQTVRMGGTKSTTGSIFRSGFIRSNLLPVLSELTKKLTILLDVPRSSLVPHSLQFATWEHYQGSNKPRYEWKEASDRSEDSHIVYCANHTTTDRWESEHTGSSHESEVHLVECKSSTLSVDRTES